MAVEVVRRRYLTLELLRGNSRRDSPVFILTAPRISRPRFSHLNCAERTEEKCQRLMCQCDQKKKNKLVEATTTRSTSGILCIHQVPLNLSLTDLIAIKAKRAEKLMIVVRWLELVIAFSMRNKNLSNVVSGSAVWCSFVKPNIGISCSLIVDNAFRYENKSLKNGSYIKITTATAAMNPCKSARLKTTSINPSLKNPSMKDIKPVYRDLF